MSGPLRRFWDRLRGSGDWSVTVPPMDGALNPNNRLEEAEIVVSAEAPDNLCRMGSAVLFSSGNTIQRIEAPGKDATASPVATFGSNVTSLASLDEALAIGLAEGKVALRGGPHDGMNIASLDGRAATCVTALAFADPHTLLVCQGSAKHPADKWKHDLMDLGANGSVWRVDLASGRATCVADRLAFPFGVMAVSGGGMLVTESWRHRVIRLGAAGGAPEIMLADLPAYPARIASRADGRGAWLTLFAPRRQLTEFVLREDSYRKRMMAEVEPDYWVGPTLAPMKSFLEPLQGGTLKKLAAIKPWAPSRSYGLVARLDENWQPVASLHSRADGTRHGITSAIEADGRLLAASQGSNAVVAVDLAVAEG
jgi:hypothetical protein